MAVQTTILDKFVSILHRRMIVIRLAEGGGIGLIVGSATVLVTVVCQFIFHGTNSLNAIWTTTAGIFTGLLFAWFFKPSRFQAAVEADRQLQLNDLMTTALTLRAAHANADGAFSTAVSHAADDAASRQRPGKIRLGRLNPKAWAFAAILLSLDVTMSLTSWNQSRAFFRSENNALASSSNRAANETVDHPLLDLAVHSDSATNARPDPVDLTPNRLGQNQTPMERDSGKGKPAAESEGNSRAPKTSNGSGGGVAHSKSPATHPPTSESAAEVRTSPKSHVGELVAGGGGVESVDGAPADGSIATPGIVNLLMNLPPKVDANARWETGSWRSDVENARQSITAGQAPAAYRDIIRAYFQ